MVIQGREAERQQLHFVAISNGFLKDRGERIKIGNNQKEGKLGGAVTDVFLGIDGRQSN